MRARTRPASGRRVRALTFLGVTSLFVAGGLTASALLDDPGREPVLWVAPQHETSATTPPSGGVPVPDARRTVPEPTADAPASASASAASDVESSSRPTEPEPATTDDPNDRPAETSTTATTETTETTETSTTTSTTSTTAAGAAPTTEVQNSPDDARQATASAAPTPRATPRRVVSSRIDIDDYPVRPVALEPDGKLEVPDETEIGWYELGAAPGEAGVTVLAAHVSWNRTLGPFAYLGDMKLGDVVTVENDDGTVVDYEVVEVNMHLKTDLSQEDIWRNVGDQQLALITCGGEFDDSINRYKHNIVVIAEPIG